MFRHYDDITFDSWLRCADPYEFLQTMGYSINEIERDLVAEYGEDDALTEWNVHAHWAPRVRFLVATLGGGAGHLTWAATASNSDADNIIKRQDYAAHDDDEPCSLDDNDNENPADLRAVHTLRLTDAAKRAIRGSHYFPPRPSLDRAIAPRHAYLQHHNIRPHGSELLIGTRTAPGAPFSQPCGQSPRAFADLCNAWDDDNDNTNTIAIPNTRPRPCKPGSAPLVPAYYRRRSSPCRMLGLMTRCLMPSVPLLLQHGANHLEYDAQGLVPLFWAAGAGHVEAVDALLLAHTSAYNDDATLLSLEEKCARVLLNERAPRDGATVLHWAACGILAHSNSNQQQRSIASERVARCSVRAIVGALWR